MEGVVIDLRKCVRGTKMTTRKGGIVFYIEPVEGGLHRIQYESNNKTDLRPHNGRKSEVRDSDHDIVSIEPVIMEEEFKVNDLVSAYLFDDLVMVGPLTFIRKTISGRYIVADEKGDWHDVFHVTAYKKDQPAPEPEVIICMPKAEETTQFLTGDGWGTSSVGFVNPITGDVIKWKQLNHSGKEKPVHGNRSIIPNAPEGFYKVYLKSDYNAKVISKSR